MTRGEGLQSRWQGDAGDRSMIWHLSPPDYPSASSPRERLSKDPTSASVKSRASVLWGAEVSSVVQKKQGLQGRNPRLTATALTLQTLH